jgi:hypothetical protein
MGFFILSLLSARDLDIGPEGFGPRDDISRRLMTRAHEKGHVLIYLSHILPGQITCYCPRKMLFPRRQMMLLLHMQIRRYFNKICDKQHYT